MPELSLKLGLIIAAVIILLGILWSWSGRKPTKRVVIAKSSDCESESDDDSDSDADMDEIDEFDVRREAAIFMDQQAAYMENKQ